MKPGKWRQQEDNAGELGRHRTKPIHCHLVDHNGHATTGEDAQDHKGQVGVMKWY